MKHNLKRSDSLITWFGFIYCHVYVPPKVLYLSRFGKHGPNPTSVLLLSNLSIRKINWIAQMISHPDGYRENFELDWRILIWKPVQL